MMKFFIIRKLKVLIGLTIIGMFYLSFKMHSKDNTDESTPNKRDSLKGVISNFFGGDLGKLFYISNYSATINISLIPQPITSFNFSVRVTVNGQKPHVFTPVTEYRSMWKKDTYHDTFSEPNDFTLWRSKAEEMCDGLMIGYNSNFLYTSDLVIDRNACKCARFGGEPIKSVIMQSEMDEYYTFDMGCFKKKCSIRPNYQFLDENHLNSWMFSLSTQSFGKEREPEEVHVVEEFTIAITRYEYANLYHTMTDWYNAFLVKEFFNHTAFKTNVLLIDAHPGGSLDQVWSHLFNSTQRLSSLPTRTRFKQLAWGIQGYNSPMGIRITKEKLPVYEEFRHFFLDSYGIKDKMLPKHECKKFNILFIWRRDYIAHPRNPQGLISRKIANELQLLNYLRHKLPKDKFRVKGLQIDVFDMKEQLRQITWADILIGMHGAGLTHAVFLKENSALIELTPNYMFDEQHFAAIAKWRNLVYNSWSNTDPLKELPNKSTIIPPSVVLTLVKKTIKDLCTSSYRALFPPANGTLFSSSALQPVT